MISFGNKELDTPNMRPDHTATFLIANSSGQALDYPSGAHIMRISYCTTAGVPNTCWLCPSSTKASIPTAGLTTLASTAQMMVSPSRLVTIASATGFSVAAPSSGYVHCEFWGI